MASKDKQKVAFLLQYKGRVLDEAFSDRYFRKLKIDKIEGSVNAQTGTTTAYVHHSKKLLSEQWFNAVKKHNARFPREQIEWVGITAPDPYDLRHTEAYKSIRRQKDFEWQKESCKERPLGHGRKRKSPPQEDTKKQQRQVDALQELAKQQLARSFIEASISYLLERKKEEAAMKAEAQAKAAAAEARERLREQQAQRVREEEEEDKTHLKALEPALQQLSSLCGFGAIIAPSVFLRHLYLTHPPPGGAPQLVPGADRKNLLNAIRAYHTDKQSACARRTHLLCGEITKLLNGLLEAQHRA